MNKLNKINVNELYSNSDNDKWYMLSDEDKFCDKEIEKRQEDARKAVMRWRENGAIS